MVTVAVAVVLAAASDGGVEWRSIAPGVEYRTFVLEAKPSIGDGVLHAVRVDPTVATVDAALASEKGPPRTAAKWANDERFAVVINAGMFEGDHRSNTGRLVHGPHVNQAKWKKSYESVLLFGAKKAALVDRDAAGFEAQAKEYPSLVQNLRLIKSSGASVWKPNGRKWSEAMVATDAKGRLLLLFSRTPYEMAELTKRVVALVGVERAMHVEGGPEASLSIHTQALSLDLCGSYETGFVENDDNHSQWDLPNVLGVRPGAP